MAHLLPVCIRRMLLLFFMLTSNSTALMRTLYSADITEEMISHEEMLMLVVENNSTPIEERILALDTLSYFSDPRLFQYFKDVAFKSEGKELQLHAVTLLGSFTGTYRLPEMCDTLTDVFQFHKDADIRLAALMCLMDIAPYLPCDRNRVIDALIYILDPQTYVKDARIFFNAVFFLVEIASATDSGAVATLEYLKINYEKYAFDNLIDATDEYKTFTNGIGKTYIEKVMGQSAPALIDEMFQNAVTKDYITAIAFMLDSVATDELGFNSIGWLLQNGENENGDEKERLEYLASIVREKRPDSADEILSALNPLLEKYGVPIKVHLPMQGNNTSVITSASVDAFTHLIIVKGLMPGSVVRVFTVSGKQLYKGISKRTVLRCKMPGSTAHTRFIVTANNVAVQTCIRN